METNQLHEEHDNEKCHPVPVFFKSMKSVQAWDYWVRVVLRFVALGFFSLIIIGQTVAVYYLVWEGLRTNQLQNLSIIFTALVTGTLAETYLIVKEMIRWIFTDNPYDVKKNSNS
jgi:hypothetical protein